eukprot:TRINITY_DN9077_c0_g1_i1.p2 TRINITY_DN9077_c0_g1~~TRINITY_DN9077_c0_g1_i1.p2  ORF type:complete len:107 (+),score=6.28 TRINITY_DN9077_c0_g1_i1:381-701(+)
MRPASPIRGPINPNAPQPFQGQPLQGQPLQGQPQGMRPAQPRTAASPGKRWDPARKAWVQIREVLFLLEYLNIYSFWMFSWKLEFSSASIKFSSNGLTLLFVSNKK